MVEENLLYLEDYLRKGRPANDNGDNAPASVISHTAGFYTEEQASNSKQSFTIDFYQAITSQPELSDIIVDRIGFQLYLERFFIRENFHRDLVKETNLNIGKPGELPSQLEELKKFIGLKHPQDGPKPYSLRCQKEGNLYVCNFAVTLKKESLQERLWLKRV